jgi:hypothetical protein
VAKNVAVDVDGLVTQALVKLATADGPLRLTGKGIDPPALFPTGSGTNKEVITRLKSSELIAESRSGRNTLVSLTEAGFLKVAGAIPEDKIGAIAKAVAVDLKLNERIEFINEVVRLNPIATADLLPILEAAVAEEKFAADERARAAAKRRETETESLAAIDRWKATIEERRRARIEALQAELAAEGVESTDLELPPRSTTKYPRTHDSNVQTPAPDDMNFRRQLARRLVSSWIEAVESKKTEALQFLETAIWNISEFRQIGEVGQTLPFDGRYHEGGAGLFTGGPVKIVRPGWVLQEEDDREYILLKALVVS